MQSVMVLARDLLKTGSDDFAKRALTLERRLISLARFANQDTESCYSESV